MKKRFWVFGVSAMLFTMLISTGCASIIKGPNQYVSVLPMEGEQVAQGSQCSVANGKGSWTTVPGGTVRVQKSKEPLQVRCENKNNGTLGVAEAQKSTQVVWAIANFFMWDFCTISCLIDFASGSIYEYPSQIQVQMHPLSSQEAYLVQIIRKPETTSETGDDARASNSDPWGMQE